MGRIPRDDHRIEMELVGLERRMPVQIVGQRLSEVPWKYQGEPLSASTSPYFFMARSTWMVSGRRFGEITKPALSRNLAPIGG